MDKAPYFLSIILFVLSFPLGIVGNLLAPKLRDWYATTSQMRLRARIDFLSNELRKSEQLWTFSEAEWAQFRTRTRAIQMFCIIAGCVFWSFVPIVNSLIINYINVHTLIEFDKAVTTKLAEALSRQTLSSGAGMTMISRHEANVKFLIGLFIPVVGYFVAAGFAIWTRVDDRTHFYMHTTEGRKELARNMAQLTAKLEKTS